MCQPPFHDETLNLKITSDLEMTEVDRERRLSRRMKVNVNNQPRLN